MSLKLKATVAQAIYCLPSMKDNVWMDPLSFIVNLSKEIVACNFIKKETLTQVFSCEIYEISKNTFSIEHLMTASEDCLTKLFYQRLEKHLKNKKESLQCSTEWVV